MIYSNVKNGLFRNDFLLSQIKGSVQISYMEDPNGSSKKTKNAQVNEFLDDFGVIRKKNSSTKMIIKTAKIAYAAQIWYDMAFFISFDKSRELKQTPMFFWNVHTEP